MTQNLREINIWKYLHLHLKGQFQIEWQEKNNFHTVQLWQFVSIKFHLKNFTKIQSWQHCPSMKIAMKPLKIWIIVYKF